MSSGKKTGLPAEAMAFAKSMGVDLKGMEPEAEEIWKMLDTMSKNDPIQYENFLRQQYENAQNSEEDKNTKSFRPTVGYCVKTQTKEGDGIKVREIKANSVTGKTLYINVCGSKYVDAPVDRSGNPLSEDRLSADGLSIPLVIGPSRDIEEGKHLAIDVIVNTMVVDVALQQPVFKKQITELAVEWVTKESSIKLASTQWEDVASPYKGGLGTDAAAPVRFVIDDGEGTERKEKADQKSGTLLSPDALLSSLKKEESEKDKLEPSIKIENAVPFKAATAANATEAAKAAAATAAAPKKSLIQEVNSDGSVTAAQCLDPPAASAASAQDTSPKPPAAAPTRSLPSSSDYKHMEDLMEQLDGDFVSSSSQHANELAENEELSRAVLGDLGRVLGGGGVPLPPAAPQNGSSSGSVKSVRIPITEEEDEEKEQQEEVVLSAAAKLRMPSASSLVLVNRSVEGSFVDTNIEFRAHPSDKFRWTLRFVVTGLSPSLAPEQVDLQIGPEEIVINVPNQCIEGAQVQSGVSYVGAKWTRGMVLTGYRFDRSSAIAVLRVSRGSLVVRIDCIHS